MPNNNSRVYNATALDVTGVVLTTEPALVHSVMCPSGGALVINDVTRNAANEVVRGGIRPQNYPTPIPCHNGIHVSATSGTCTINLQWEPLQFG